jgi:hypothetical protein
LAALLLAAWGCSGSGSGGDAGPQSDTSPQDTGGGTTDMPQGGDPMACCTLNLQNCRATTGCQVLTFGNVGSGDFQVCSPSTDHEACRPLWDGCQGTAEEACQSLQYCRAASCPSCDGPGVMAVFLGCFAPDAQSDCAAPPPCGSDGGPAIDGPASDGPFGPPPDMMTPPLP